MSVALREKPDIGEFVLPGGFLIRDGRRERRVKLRHLTGREEEIILQAESFSSSVSTILTHILANCILSIGELKEITPDIVRQLLVCDRDYLLLKLRQMTFGDRINARVRCPNKSCQSLMDIDFDISSIEVDRKELGNNNDGTFTIHLSRLASYKDANGAVHSDVAFRLPTVEDQEEIEELFIKNQSRALTKLLERCLIRIGTLDKVDENLVCSLPVLARREIDSKMYEISPKIDLEVRATCPNCGTEFASPFNLQNFFLLR